GILSIAPIPAHRGFPAHRHSLSGPLPHRPRSPFTGRRRGRGVVLPDPWLVPADIEGHGFHQRALDSGQSVLMESQSRNTTAVASHALASLGPSAVFEFEVPA